MSYLDTNLNIVNFVGNITLFILAATPLIIGAGMVLSSFS